MRLLANRYVVAAAGLAYGFTVGLRKARNRELIANVARHFGYSGATPGTLPRVDFDAATDPMQAIVLPAAVGKSGNVSELELIALARLARASRATSILEIGTFDGRTTVALAANAPSAVVCTLDLPRDAQSSLPIEMRDVSMIDKPASGERFANTPYASRIRQLYGDSATFDFGDERVDLAFIDGAHSYEYVLSDSARIRPLMRAGGVMLWHDYGVEWEGVTRALDQLARESDFRGMQAIRNTSLAMLRIP